MGDVWEGGDGEQEGEFPRWEAGKLEENYATVCNILQSKKRKGPGACKNGVETTIKGYRK